MKNNIVLMIAAALAISAQQGQALGAIDLLNESPAKALLEKKCISAQTSGQVAVPFRTASDVLKQSDLVQLIQQEYANQRSKEGGKAAFPLIATAPGKFHYFNNKGKRTDVQELYRKQTADGTFDYIIQASGKRFFGHYDVIIHLQITDTSETGIAYTAYIHAYPHSGTMRFFARKLGTVERYFKNNTESISDIAQKVGEGLCKQT